VALNIKNTEVERLAEVVPRAFEWAGPRDPDLLGMTGGGPAFLGALRDGTE
jgi:hypothetical protein